MAVLIELRTIFDRRVLVTRDAAHVLGDAIRRILGSSDVVGREHEVRLDFDQIDAVTPSFVDEALGVIDEVLASKQSLRIVFLNAPTRFSEKFAAIGRARGVLITEEDEHTWSIVRSPNAA